MWLMTLFAVFFPYGRKSSESPVALLTGQGLLPETRNYLGCLLYDLIHYFSDEITAPRWLRTADGVKFIDGVEVKA